MDDLLSGFVVIDGMTTDEFAKADLGGDIQAWLLVTESDGKSIAHTTIDGHDVRFIPVSEPSTVVVIGRKLMERFHKFE